MPAALILTLDAALDGCSAAVVANDAVLAERRHAGGRGSAAALPEMARQVLAEAGATVPGLSMIAVTVGPGSFTGLRAALALAQGLALAGGVPLRGVSVGAAIPAEADEAPPLWVVIDSRRGRVFLDRDGTVRSLPLEALPLPDGAVALAGDAAPAAAAWLTQAGCTVRCLDRPAAGPLGIARAACAGGGPAVPLYLDPVEARPGPAGRPAPA